MSLNFLQTHKEKNVQHLLPSIELSFILYRSDADLSIHLAVKLLRKYINCDVNFLMLSLYRCTGNSEQMPQRRRSSGTEDQQTLLMTKDKKQQVRQLISFCPTDSFFVADWVGSLGAKDGCYKLITYYIGKCKSVL